MVAGGTSRYGKTDLKIVGKGKTADGRYYKEEILPVFKECMDKELVWRILSIFLAQTWLFYCKMEHEHILHSASMEQIKSEFNDVWQDWPGNSLDLNVIENVWATLQDSVFVTPKPRNREQLIDRVKKTWYKLPQLDLSNLVTAFPERINDVLAAEGGSTKN